jgi:hypothetical protein
MAARKQKKTPEEAAKTRLLFRARKLARDVHRYATFGYVTESEAYEKDDQRLLKAIDGLYDSARKAGIGEDLELQQVRFELRRSWSDARRAALEIRAQKFQAKADALRAAACRIDDDPGFASYRAELQREETRRRARREPEITRFADGSGHGPGGRLVRDSERVPAPKKRERPVIKKRHGFGEKPIKLPPRVDPSSVKAGDRVTVTGYGEYAPVARAIVVQVPDGKPGYAGVIETKPTVRFESGEQEGMNRHVAWEYVHTGWIDE